MTDDELHTFREALSELIESYALGDKRRREDCALAAVGRGLTIVLETVPADTLTQVLLMISEQMRHPWDPEVKTPGAAFSTVLR